VLIPRFEPLAHDLQVPLRNNPSPCLRGRWCERNGLAETLEPANPPAYSRDRGEAAGSGGVG
jgi:hypothetical protein